MHSWFGAGAGASDAIEGVASDGPVSAALGVDGGVRGGSKSTVGDETLIGSRLDGDDAGWGVDEL